MQNKVTEIQIIPVKPKDGLVGFASFVFDRSFYCASIGIYTRPQGGFRLTYPTRKTLNGAMPIFHPINKDVANLIEQAIIRQFERLHDNE
ncbi:MAG: septation protein SpoVG family protein [Candidatus Dependentiae bacterium]|nr:septation protein SpoVG family protein [Candidatus Dependentiae bacterium]